MKRVFDIVLSFLVVCCVLSWLMPFIAFLVKISSKGPVFFVQRRIGKDGRSFSCLKFRTMIVNEQANSQQAYENDHRITRIGNFLRKTNLDEFPQFLNVLVGDMSIVGPRPHMLADCRKFASVVENYAFRHLVKPGITGLAQVKGFRGATEDISSIFRRFQFDAYYVRNASFGMDLQIITETARQTISAILRFRNKKATVKPAIKIAGPRVAA